MNAVTFLIICLLKDSIYSLKKLLEILPLTTNLKFNSNSKLVRHLIYQTTLVTHAQLTVFCGYVLLLQFFVLTALGLSNSQIIMNHLYYSFLF